MKVDLNLQAKVLLLLMFIIGLIFSIVPTAVVASDNSLERVQKIEATVNCAEYQLPQLVQARVTETVRVVSEKIIVGSTLAEIESKKAQDAILLKEVFNRALMGYVVDDVEIIAGQTTKIIVNLHLLGDVVKAVKVTCNFHGVDQDFNALFLTNINAIQKKIEDTLIFLPIDAVDWSGNLVKLAVQEYFTLELPDYRPSIEIVAGQTVKVNIEAIPIGTQIRSTQIKLKTQSFPNAMLYDFRSQLEELSQRLNGLPVALVITNKAFFDNWLYEKAITNSVAQRWGLFVKVDLEPAADTEILIDTKAEKYNVYAEGYFDFGKDKDNVSGKAHVGRYWSKRDELFTELQFVPSTLKWHILLGTAHKIDKYTYFAVKYDFTQKGIVLWLHQDIGKRWKFEVDRFMPTGSNEFRLRYMLHDYGGLEYVVNSNENFLRFVAIF